MNENKLMTREELEYMMMDLHVICLMKDEEIKTLKESINNLNNELEKLMNENEQLRKDNNEAVLSLAKEKVRLKDLLVDKDKQIKNWINYYKILHEIKNEQVKENKQLKKQIDELVYENSKLGEFNIHMYVREQDKLMRENEQLRRDNNEEVLTLAKEKARLKDLLIEKDKQIKNWSQSYGELCNINEEQTKEIFRLREANNNQEKIIKKQENTIDEIVEARYNIEDELSMVKYDLDNLKIKLKKTKEEKISMAKYLDIYISAINQLDKKLEVAMKDKMSYRLRIDELENKMSDRVGECAKCSHSGCATCKTNPPCECDTESKSMVDDCSVDCRPRKQ